MKMTIPSSEISFLKDSGISLQRTQIRDQYEVTPKQGQLISRLLKGRKTSNSLYRHREQQQKRIDQLNLTKWFTN